MTMADPRPHHPVRLLHPRASGLSHPLVFAAGLAIALALPFLLSGYQTFQASMLLIYAVALVGLNILTGYNGQISLGHGAFFALGAYVLAVLVSGYGVPFWAAIPAAGVVSLCVGYLFGRPAARLAGHYLALATFSLAMALPPLLKHKALEPLTGGVGGLSVPRLRAPFGLPLSPDQWLYLVTLATALAMLLLAWALLRSNTGRAFRAIRDNAIAAEAMGIPVAHTKSLCFGISALYAGVAGALSALAVRYVGPDSFTFLLSIILLVGIVVGGLGTLGGALIGGAFILFVPSLAEGVSKAAPWAVYGVLLIGMMFILPGGVTSIGPRLRAYVARRRGQ